VVDALAELGQNKDMENIAKTIVAYKNFLIVGSPC
jgi:hypothetical protein